MSIGEGLFRPVFRYVVPSGPISDPYWADVVLHMAMDGSDGSTDFVDLKGHTFTSTGGAALATSSKKFGTASLYMPVNSKLATALNADFNFSNLDFTVEVHVRPFTHSNGVGSMILTNSGGPGNPGSSMMLMLDSSYRPVFQYYNTVGSWVSVVAAGAGASLSLSTWHHVAVSCVSGTIYVYVNGVMTASAARVESITDSIWSLVFGGNWNHPNMDYLSPFNGYMDNIRITKGIGRYNGANFTPPTKAYPTS